MAVKILVEQLTPFDQQGNVNFQILTQYFSSLVHKKISGVVLAGMIGEGYQLNGIEKELIVDQCLKVLGGKKEIWYTIQEANLEKCLQEVILYNKKNVTGFLIDCSYFSLKQDGVGRIVEKIIALAKHELIFDFRKTEISIESIQAFNGSNQQIGILLPDALLKSMQQIKKQLTVYVDERQLLHGLRHGATHLISVTAHLYDETLDLLLRLAHKQQIKELENLYAIYKDKMNLIIERPVEVLKALYQHWGYDMGGVRFPLIALSAEEKRHIIKRLGI